MQFQDQMLSIETPFGPTDVCVTGQALHVWWSAGVAPQTAAGLMEANAALIKHLVTIKREADEADEDGVIRISEHPTGAGSKVSKSWPAESPTTTLVHDEGVWRGGLERSLAES